MNVVRLDRRTFAKTLAASAAASLVQRSALADALPVPAYLKGYEELYAKDPRAAALKWFTDAKFGLFIHYGLVSLLPEGREQYSRIQQQMEGTDYSIERTLFERFHADKFDADFIADLAVAAGMRYVNFTTEHRGCLRMSATKTTGHSSVRSPAKRDFVGELSATCQKRRLGLFLYVPSVISRTDGENFERSHAVLRELLTQYGPIAGIWFDSVHVYYKHPELFTRLSETYAFVRSLQPQCLISFKQGATGEEDFIAPEHELSTRSSGLHVQKDRWEKMFKHKPAEICTTLNERVGRSVKWFDDVRVRHRNADEVMVLLAKARQHNANLLLSIGPLGDGSVHPDDVATLREVGRRISNKGFPG
jgi:alpha-L-fucosidase